MAAAFGVARHRLRQCAHPTSLDRAYLRAGDEGVTTVLRRLRGIRGGRARKCRVLGLGGGSPLRRARPRKLEPERAPAPRCAFDADPPSVKLDCVLHDREAEPRSALGPGPSAIDPIEAFEEAWHVLGLDAAAGVLDRDEH